MTTYVQPLAMFLTTDEVCNLFNMLLTNNEKGNLHSPSRLIVKGEVSYCSQIPWEVKYW